MSTRKATLEGFLPLKARGKLGWTMQGWASPGTASCFLTWRSPSLAIIFPSPPRPKKDSSNVSILLLDLSKIQNKKNQNTLNAVLHRLTSACPSATVAVSCLKLQILKFHDFHLHSSGPRFSVLWHMWVLEGGFRLLWWWWWRAVTVRCSVARVRGRGALAGQGGRVDGDSDRGWCCYCGDGLAEWREVGVVMWKVLGVVGRAGSVAC